jgi:hypothetical protein
LRVGGRDEVLPVMGEALRNLRRGIERRSGKSWYADVKVDFDPSLLFS